MHEIVEENQKLGHNDKKGGIMQTLRNLWLSIVLGSIFMVEAFKSFRAEIKDPGLYPQAKYSTCVGRSMAILENAFSIVRNIYALAVLNHRCGVHEESHEVEKDSLLEDLGGEGSKYVKIAARNWWKW